MKLNLGYSAKIPLWGIFIVLLFAVLYFAQSVLIPIFLAFIASFLLTPVVKTLKKIRIPTAVGSFLVLTILTLSLGTLFNYLAEPVSIWVERFPSEIKQIERKLTVFKDSIENVQETTDKIDEITSGNSSPSKNKEVVVKGPGLLDMILNNTQSFILGALTFIVLLYFLLAFGGELARDLGKLWLDKGYRIAFIRIAKDARLQLSRYLLLITLINFGLGIVVSTVMWAIDMPNPIVWGASVALLNYIPYIGPMMNLAIITVASLLTFNEVTQILIPPLLLFIIYIAEGQFIQPLLLGKLLTINPLLIFISVIFWGWLWGVAGIFMAVPILMLSKIVFEHTVLVQNKSSV